MDEPLFPDASPTLENAREYVAWPNDNLEENEGVLGEAMAVLY